MAGACRKPPALAGTNAVILLLASGVSVWQPAYAQNAAAERLEEIIVTPSIVAQPRRQIGTAVSVIEAEDIELRGYTDLADVLRTQTGIAVSNSGGLGKATAVNIRGEDSFRTLLMIDGVKALDVSAPQVSPSFDSLLATGDLQRVEVLRGPQGFIYGADAGGVVNVMTKRGAGDLGGQLGIEYGEHSTRRLDAALSGGGDGGDYFVSAVDVRTDGFNARAADTVLRDEDGADNTTLHTKLGWNAAENVRIQLVARGIDAEAAYDGCGFPTVHDCATTTEQITYKMSADVTTGNFTNAFGYSHVDVARDNFTSGASVFATEGKLGRFEYTGTFRPSGALALVYGADLQAEEFSDGFAERSRNQNGYYFEYQGAFDGAFFLSAGARYDDNDDFGAHTSTRASLAYVQALGAGRSLKYRASVGTGFRAPSLFEVSYNGRAIGVLPAALAASLTEERSRGYDVGIDYTSAAGVRFEVTYFDHDIEDEIGYTFDPATFEDGYVQLQGESESTGVEVGVEVPLGARWAMLANWTKNDANTVTATPRLRRPEGIGNLGVRFVSANEALRFIANYRASRDAIDLGGVPLEDYAVLDLSLSYDMSDTLQIHGRVRNAADERYQEVVGYNAAGRSIYGGVRLRF